MLPLSLIFGGSLIAATASACAAFVIDDLIRDAGVPSLLPGRAGHPAAIPPGRSCAGRSVPRRDRDHGHRVTLVLDPSLRARGTFPNPNIPAHLLACAVMLFAVDAAHVGCAWSWSGSGPDRPLPHRLVRRHAAAPGGRWLPADHLAARSHPDPGAPAGGLLRHVDGVVTLATVFGVNSYLNRPEAKQESGLSAARLDELATRFEVWGDAFENFTTTPSAPVRAAAESSSCSGPACPPSPQRTAVVPGERGFIGFAGLLLLWVTVWRLTRPRGAWPGPCSAAICWRRSSEKRSTTGTGGSSCRWRWCSTSSGGRRPGPRSHAERPRWWRSVDRPTLRTGGTAERGPGVPAPASPLRPEMAAVRSAATRCPASPGPASAMAPRARPDAGPGRPGSVRHRPRTSASPAPRSSSSASASSSPSRRSARPWCSDRRSNGAIW